MPPKINVVKDLHLYLDQKERLKSLGEVTFYDNDPQTEEEWLKRCQDADIICSGIFGVNSEKLYQLKDVFISLPFVGVEFLDQEKLAQNNITVSNAPGCNKEAVAEWIIGMLLMHLRRLDKLNRVTDLDKSEILKTDQSLYGKNITILGAGNIGTHLGKICDAFGMNFTYFRRGDDLIESVKEADFIANCLRLNESTTGLLDDKFFSSLKRGSIFISVSRNQVYNLKALTEALNKNIISIAIDDTPSGQIGDSNDPEYKKLLSHPKIMATPHVAWNTDSEIRKSNDIMINNIEAWINKKPINLI